MGEWNEKGLEIARRVPGDVSAIRMIATRDDTSVGYEVRVSLRSLARTAYEEGEDELCVWEAEVSFGQTDATVAGGSAFVQAAREQAAAAERVWAETR